MGASDFCAVCRVKWGQELDFNDRLLMSVVPNHFRWMECPDCRNAWLGNPDWSHCPQCGGYGVEEVR